MSDPGLYRTIRDQIRAVWTTGWAFPAVPVYWRENDAEVLPDPSQTQYFMRNEVDFGVERVRAFGGGRFANERLKFGSLLIRLFMARSLLSDDEGLDMLSSAEAMFRSVKVGELSFIGDISSFDESGTIPGEFENGNWFMRGSLIVFEYRFVG